MQTQRLWLQVAAFLVLVWAGVAAVMWATEDYVFTPEKTLALMSESPWYENERLGHEQRMQHLDKVITSVVKLDFSQRARMREDGEETIDRFMKSLSDEEKGEYIGRVVEEHFNAVMKGIDKLPAEDRRRIIGTIHRDMKKRTAKNPEMQLLIDMDPAGFEKNFTQDMGLFFKEAPLSAKLEMAPMLESFHARMQGLRR
jgi:predicted metalloprotease with PDZ domain